MRAVVARLGASADHPAIADRLAGAALKSLAATALLMAAVRFATAKKGKASGGQG
jgi:hypothetical protein